jgi:hypothetical protein
MRADRSGMNKALRLIDRRTVGQRDDGAWTHVILPISLHY